MIYVGIDDTDTAESRGTGKLARSIAQDLTHKYPVFGVTRHQLFVHPDIPFTSHNSCAVIHVQAPASAVDDIFERSKKLMLADFINGSDPGLAIAETRQVTSAAVAFGQDAKTMIVTQQRAREVARNCGIRVEGLGGTNGGTIGAVAGIGLASIQNDGRFLLKGKNRELSGVRSVEEIINAEIDQVMTLKGETITVGRVNIPKNATPSFINGKAVLFVELSQEGYIAIKRA
ncbi:MAG: ABC transporter substrate-binding protein [Betaproteobacteria bacterium]